MSAPGGQLFDAASHGTVVPEASTFCGCSYRILPAPSKQRTQSRPPSAPPASQCARATSLAEAVSAEKAMPRLHPAAARARLR
jgi:hypothetical protein